MAAPHHRHQASLEGILDTDFSRPPLEPGVRARAGATFNVMCDRFDTGPVSSGEWSRPTLLRLTHSSAVSDQSRDYFLRCFFHFVSLPMDVDVDDASTSSTEARSQFFSFAEQLYYKFFLISKSPPQLNSYASR